MTQDVHGSAFLAAKLSRRTLLRAGGGAAGAAGYGALDWNLGSAFAFSLCSCCRSDSSR
jgi:hypothetical protein